MLRRHRNGLAFARGLALLAILGVGFILGPSVGRADTQTQTYYMKQNAFEIPYAVSADQNLKQLYLHVSTDRKSYTQIASTAKRNDLFEYTAKGDGEYSFVVQVEDTAGVLTPPKPELGIPTLRVVVDTQKPQVALRAVVPNKHRVAVEWRISDANLDLRTLHLEAKGQGETTWTPLTVTLLKEAHFDWSPQGNGPFDVRLSVKDLAGNEATATTQVTPTAGAAPIPGQTDDAPVNFVRNKKFRLTYKIDGAGRSSVKEVQVWMTRDKSQWSKYGPSAPATGPFEISVLSTGRYGFTLRPMSGVGRGPTPPRGGDAPQIWVEVDEKPPVVQLRNVQVGEGAEGKIVVNWVATDDFLKDKPVAILYSDSPTGPWKILKENLENTGTANVTPPEEVFEFFVKVEAVDKAGNKGSSQLKESIKVDLAVPTASGIGVEAIDPNPPASQPSP